MTTAKQHMLPWLLWTEMEGIVIVYVVVSDQILIGLRRPIACLLE